MSKTTSQPNLVISTGLIMPLSFFLLFLANSLVLYLANLLFPTFVVLGTYFHTPGLAIFFSMLLLSLYNTFTIPLVHYHEKIRNRMYSSWEWLRTYFVLNFLGLWVITRLAAIFGLGISGWWVALLLAAAFDWIQGLAMMALSRLTN